MICPDCNGAKQFTGFVCRYGPNGGRGGIETYNCHTCDGVGTITPEHAAVIATGQRMRAERIARNESLREMAKRIGVSAVALSNAERGKIKP